ncbi:FMN phosphatase YigB (HAD superfamily) [Altererythrobacter atlanticus]|uniref:Uncharacterized protein n=1 Tax=Croceibacterium atlanticum TaxID=1267766 RepID=A0A0F7KY50_9SPHN|nr:HAD family hydrolase [Croceibacterium atlanticum]AKH44171.1 hypothetical protein WYH_03152 [Croceibacterium atlanticum]MBB5732482.1 FMN phosphatase YigB (HAD superfamily) [Croceibacterium atlanticum]
MTVSLSPHQFDQLLGSHPGIQCLSLDCFDTLLWRDTHSPRDIFHGLPGISIIQRSSAESRARRAAQLNGRGSEVTIADIYDQLLPNADRQEREAAIEEEIAAEARHCFGFAPVVQLMVAAKQRGLKIAVVSDTYLDSDQLLSLIAKAAGQDVADLIDHVFCSCAFGKSKSGGVYHDVLRKLKLPGNAILHVGDNRSADIDGVKPFGVNTAHLAQFANSTEQRLRLEAAIDRMIHPHRAEKVAATLPHRAALSIAEPLAESPAERLGMTLLGPVFCGFERWLKSEAKALESANGGNVHWCFLMRDGHLPMMVHSLFGKDENAHALEISRYTAVAASLTTEKALQRFIEQNANLDPFILARQLLIDEEQIRTICADLPPAQASQALLRELRTGQRKKSIIRASREMAERLIAHIANSVRPKTGDTLMLVDLGYNGTVQNRIDGLLAERLSVKIAGRFLLLRENDRPGLDKKGFIGADHYDAFTLESLCANVAVLEQLSTRATGSTIDYEEDGTPVRQGNEIKETQSATRDAIQAGCLKFQAFEETATIRNSAELDLENWRRGAANVLARMMFLPTAEELNVIEQFEHDVNLGTARTTGLFDKTIAHRGLRKRGLFYMNGSERMYLPAEIQGQGMATRLSLLTQRRFGLPLTFGDMADATIELPVIFADSKEAVPQLVTATNTHDGFFMAAIPVGASQYSVALQFGALFEYFELDSLSFHPVEEFLSLTPDDPRNEQPAEPVLDGIEKAAGRLMHCQNEAGFMMVSPPHNPDGQQLLLACVFRPTVIRKAATSPANTADVESGQPLAATEIN